MRLREIMQISHERAQFSLWSNEPWTVLLYAVHSGRFKIGPFRKRLRTCSKNLCAMMINCHFASSFWDSLLTMLHGTHMYRYSCDSWLCANDLIIIQSGTHNTEWTRKSYLSSRKKTFSALCFWTSSHRIARYTHVSLFSYLLYDVILLLHSNTCDQRNALHACSYSRNFKSSRQQIRAVCYSRETGQKQDSGWNFAPKFELKNSSFSRDVRHYFEV
jgi:hypothetical protein